MAVGPVMVFENSSTPRSVTISVIDMDMDVSEGNGCYP